DPLPLATDDRQAVQVSVFVPGPATVQTFHWEGRQTSWIAPDPLPLATDDRQAVQVSVFVPGPATVQTFHWEGR
ncbi:hypothetical protein C7E12_22855, partial [Stenotrophomonas maltophilia]